MKLLNTAGVADALGVSVRRVRQMIAEEKLPAQKVGRDYAIEESALKAVTVYGKPGRPSKQAIAAPKSTGEILRTDKTARKLNQEFGEAAETQQRTGKKGRKR